MTDMPEAPYTATLALETLSEEGAVFARVAQGEVSLPAVTLDPVIWNALGRPGYITIDVRAGKWIPTPDGKQEVHD